MSDGKTQDPEFQAMKARLQELLDKQEITDVIMKYARAVDRADPDLIKEVFHPDAYEDHAGLFVGSGQEFMDNVIPSMRTMGNATHHMTNPLIEVDGDRATGECYLISMVHVLEESWGKEFDWFLGGRFVHVFEKRDGVWKILHRKAINDWNQYFEHRDDWGKGAVPWPNMIVGTKDKSDHSYSPGGTREGLPRTLDQAVPGTKP